MKKSGILNAELNSVISRLGHTDVVIVADCGMPQPDGVEVIDLALIHGVPSFGQTLGAVLAELQIEGAVSAQEAVGTSASRVITDAFEPLGLTVSQVPHAELKEISAQAKLFIRTGEATPYANVALYCGVPF